MVICENGLCGVLNLDTQLEECTTGPTSQHVDSDVWSVFSVYEHHVEPMLGSMENMCS